MIQVPISIGELLDKLTILDIKMSRITCPDKLSNVALELALLSNIYEETVSTCFDPVRQELNSLRESLHSVNSKLWDIEDQVRECERQQDFGRDFVVAARNVYIYNDNRSDIKRKINTICGSKIIEEKSYASY